jgi:multidrug resistance efflux pump
MHASVSIAVSACAALLLAGQIPELPPGTLPPVALPGGVALVQKAETTKLKRAGGDAEAGRLRLPATFVPAATVRVCPRVLGQVVEVLVHEGDAVKRGQVLIRLDSAEYKLGVDRARAGVERARAALSQQQMDGKTREQDLKQAQAEADAADAARAYAGKKTERMRDLVKRAAVDVRLLDEAESQLHTNEAEARRLAARYESLRTQADNDRSAVAKAAVAEAQVIVQQAELRLAGADIRAPIDGTVLARHVDVGDEVGPNSAAGRAASLCELADLNQLDAVIEIPENAIERIHTGTKCAVRMDALPERSYEGRVTLISPVFSGQTRTAQARVRIEIPKGTQRLRPGMFGVVEVAAQP